MIEDKFASYCKEVRKQQPVRWVLSTVSIESCVDGKFTTIPTGKLIFDLVDEYERTEVEHFLDKIMNEIIDKPVIPNYEIRAQIMLGGIDQSYRATMSIMLYHNVFTKLQIIFRSRFSYDDTPKKQEEQPVIKKRQRFYKSRGYRYAVKRQKGKGK